MRGLALSLLALLTPACGYHTLRHAHAEERWSVSIVDSHVPSAAVVDALAQGTRERLARAGALRAGEGYPRVEIELLRADEVSEGIAATPSGDSPRARGSALALVARAWIMPSRGGEAIRDTGDVRAAAAMGAGESAYADASQHEILARSLARRLGHRLAERVIGFAAPSDDAF